MVHDLIAPMIERMNGERLRMQTMNERAEAMEARMAQIEYINGVADKRPKVFEDISDRFSQEREDRATVVARLNNRMDNI